MDLALHRKQTDRLLWIIRHLSKKLLSRFEILTKLPSFTETTGSYNSLFVLSGKVCLPTSLSSFCCWWHKGKNTLEESRKHEGSEGLAVCPPGFSGVEGIKWELTRCEVSEHTRGWGRLYFSSLPTRCLRTETRDAGTLSGHHHYISITSAQWQHHNTDITASTSHQHYNIITSTSQHQHHITRHSSTSSTFFSITLFQIPVLLNTYVRFSCTCVCVCVCACVCVGVWGCEWVSEWVSVCVCVCVLSLIHIWRCRRWP